MWIFLASGYATRQDLASQISQTGLLVRHNFGFDVIRSQWATSANEGLSTLPQRERFVEIVSAQKSHTGS
jgi:hypothetical protein